MFRKIMGRIIIFITENYCIVTLFTVYASFSSKSKIFQSRRQPQRQGRWRLSSKRFVRDSESEILFILSRSRPIFTISLFETFNCMYRSIFYRMCPKLTQLPLLAILYRFIQLREKRSCFIQESRKEGDDYCTRI